MKKGTLVVDEKTGQVFKVTGRSGPYSTLRGVESPHEKRVMPTHVVPLLYRRKDS